MRTTVDMFRPARITKDQLRRCFEPNISVTHTAHNTFIVYLHAGRATRSPVGIEFIHTWDAMIRYLQNFNQVLGLPFDQMRLYGSVSHTKEKFQTALTSDSRIKEGE